MSQLIKEFTKRDLADILETIEDARNSTTPEELRSVIVKAKDLVCADYAVCGLGTISGNMILDASRIINGNCPEEWLRNYIDGKSYLKDPVIRHHTNFSMAENWSDIFKKVTDSESDAIIGNARDFGLKFGVSSGIYMPGSQSMSIFAFSGATDIFGRHQKKILNLLMLHLNNSLLRVIRRPSIDRSESEDFIPVRA